MSRFALGPCFAGLLAAAVYAQPAHTTPAPAAQASDLHLAFESLDQHVRGNGWLVPGVEGSALQLDGIAAHVLIPASEVPRLSGSFTVSGWVALGAYPFNDAPLMQQQDGEPAGWFLGVGDRGQLRFDVVAGGRRLSVVSSLRLALRQWAHVAGVFDEGKGATLYVNGSAVGTVKETGAFVSAAGSDLWIGRNASELEQSASVGRGGNGRHASCSTAFWTNCGWRPAPAAPRRSRHSTRASGQWPPRHSRLAPSPHSPLAPRRLGSLHEPAVLQGLGRHLARRRQPGRRGAIRPVAILVRILARHQLYPALGHPERHLV